MQRRPTIPCSVCEEFHEVGELRWFNLDRLNTRDRDGKWIKLPYEATAEDPNGAPYCARCASRLHVV